MEASTPSRRPLDPPRPLSLRVSFLALWFVDMITAGLFFLVPNGTELNPATVFFYHLIGLPGVVVAAGIYAAIVIAVGHSLSEPVDRYFLTAVVTAYVVLVANNVALLLSGASPVQTLLGI